jgi:signal transduction histidine kinase
MSQRTIPVLLVEDDVEYADLLIDMLKGSTDAAFVMTHCTTLAAGVQRLGSTAPHVVLLDLHLPDSEEEDTYTTITQHAPQLPIIIITSHDDRDFAERAVRMGVQDYLIKGKVNRGHLSRAIFYAIERKRVLQQEKHLAAYEERQRLARDLHDSVSQTLFSATMIAETMLHLHGEQHSSLRQGLTDLFHLTKGARSELQTLLLELRPQALTDSPLDRLLTTLVNTLASRTKAKVNVSLARDCWLPPDVQVVFYRIAQEAFNNVVKHAESTLIELNLQRTEGTISLQISDNGRGFGERQTSGLGLKIMRERVEQVGGTITIESAVGQGTSITLVWHP